MLGWSKKLERHDQKEFKEQAIKSQESQESPGMESVRPKTTDHKHSYFGYDNFGNARLESGVHFPVKPFRAPAVPPPPKKATSRHDASRSHIFETIENIKDFDQNYY